MVEGPSEDWLRRCRARMDRVNAMPRDLRECVDEYGLSIVDAFLDIGVRKAKHIHHIVKTIRRESGQGWASTDRSAILARATGEQSDER